MKSSMKLFIASISTLALTSLLTGCVPHSTGPTEVGVRTYKFGFFNAKGVEKKIYPPGSTYFFVPFLSDWNTFDTRLNTIEMTAFTGKGDRPGKDDLMFKTVDGNDISLDIIVSYRIDPSKAPEILQNVAENDAELKENIIRTVTRSKPRDLFGCLMTEEFYHADKRSQKAVETTKALNEILNPYGVIVERVDTKDYRFVKEYQQAIEDRKVAEQLAEKNKASARATEEEYLKKVEEAKGSVAKMRAEADGKYEQSVIKADAYFEQQSSIAKAIEAEGTAEAQGIRKMNAALSGTGGDSVIKLAIAQALQGKRLIMLPVGGNGLDVRSTDINSLLSLYGVKKLGSEVSHPKPADTPEPTATPAPPATNTTQQKKGK